MVDCRFVDVELADWERFVGSLSAESGAVRDPPCAASIVGAAAIATGVSGVAASCITGDGTGSAEGAAGASGCCVGNAAFGCWMDNAAGDGSLGAAVATTGGSSVWSGVAEADAVVSLLTFPSSNWLGRQPNSAQSQTSDPWMTYLRRILMTNSQSTMTNQTTN
jgi:hypothetical protein